MKKLTVNKNVVCKAAAFGAGAMVGGGLTWLGWRWLEKRGIDPMHFVKTKVEEGNRLYLEDMEFDDLVPDEIDGVEGTDEDEDDEEEEEEEPPEPRRISRSEPYQIDAETYFHSEDEEGYEHDSLTYYAGSQQMVDRNRELPSEEPWKIIGIENYEKLTEMDAGEDMYVRNEQRKIDYVISKEEGYLDD